MKVFVYYNLHRKCWSVKALEGENKGRVILHSHEVHLTNCTFRVSEAGRQRVLRERKKNVHAGIVGRLAKNNNTLKRGIEVTYNPYKHSTFVNRQDKPILTAKMVSMCVKNNKTSVLAWIST